MKFQHTLIIIPNLNKRIRITQKEINFIKKNKIKIALPLNLLTKKLNKNHFIFFNYSKETLKVFSKVNIYTENFLYDLMEEFCLKKIYFIKSSDFSFYNLKNFFRNEVIFEHKKYYNYKCRKTKNNNRILINFKNNTIITIDEFRWILIKKKKYRLFVLSFLSIKIIQFIINTNKDIEKIFFISKYYKGLLKYLYRVYKFFFQKRGIINFTLKDYILYKFFLKKIEIEENYSKKNY